MERHCQEQRREAVNAIANKFPRRLPRSHSREHFVSLRATRRLNGERVISRLPSAAMEINFARKQP